MDIIVRYIGIEHEDPICLFLDFFWYWISSLSKNLSCDL